MISIKTLKKELSQYKIVDISSINDRIKWAEVVMNIKHNVILVLYRNETKKELWSFIDFVDNCGDKKTKTIRSENYGMKIYKTYNWFGLPCEEDNRRTEKQNIQQMRLWLEISDENESCFVCSEKIEYFGPNCQTCAKSTCSDCAIKIFEIGNNKCPNCRTSYNTHR